MGPYVLGLLWKKVTRSAVWTSIVGALVLTVALIFVFGYHQNGWQATFGLALKCGIACSPMIGVICMAYSLAATAIVSLCTKAPDKETLSAAFEDKTEEKAA